jgi:hypothetical protein
VTVDGAHYDALLADLESAFRELIAHSEGDPSFWTRGRPGQWTAGQHTDHVVVVLERSARDFEAAAARLVAGELPPPPRRGPLESLWVATVLRWMPRGFKTEPVAYPGEHPERDDVIARGTRAIARHGEIAARITPADRDRLWIVNFFRPQWRYTLPEFTRVQTTHAWHHTRMVAEIVGR